MNPMSGLRIPATSQSESISSAQVVQQKIFRATTEVSTFLQSAAEQISTSINALSEAAKNATNFLPSTSAGIRNYGVPHQNIRFAANQDARKKYNEVTDIGLPNGTNTSWRDHDQAKVARPLPATYLDSTYMQEHLSQFEDGAVSFITPPSFANYTVDGNQSQYHGRADGLFVLPANWAKEMIIDAKTDPSVTRHPNNSAEGNQALLVMIEKRMGIPVGCWSTNNSKLLAVYIENPKDLNLRLPSGSEGGANIEWRPGGYTLGGVPEAFVDRVDVDVGIAVPFHALEEILTDGLSRNDPRGGN